MPPCWRLRQYPFSSSGPPYSTLPLFALVWSFYTILATQPGECLLSDSESQSSVFDAFIDPRDLFDLFLCPVYRHALRHCLSPPFFGRHWRVFPGITSSGRLVDAFGILVERKSEDALRQLPENILPMVGVFGYLSPVRVRLTLRRHR